MSNLERPAKRGLRAGRVTHRGEDLAALAVNLGLDPALLAGTAALQRLGQAVERLRRPAHTA